MSQCLPHSEKLHDKHLNGEQQARKIVAFIFFLSFFFASVLLHEYLFIIVYMYRVSKYSFQTSETNTINIQWPNETDEIVRFFLFVVVFFLLF